MQKRKPRMAQTGKVRSQVKRSSSTTRKLTVCRWQSPAPTKAEARVCVIDAGSPQQVQSVITSVDATPAALYEGASSDARSRPTFLMTCVEPSIVPIAITAAESRSTDNGTREKIGEFSPYIESPIM